MNDEQIIAEICRRKGFNYTVGELDGLVELCRHYYSNRKHLEALDNYQDRKEVGCV